MTDPTRVLVVGGGNVGTAVALRLQKHLDKQLRHGAAQITVVAPDPYIAGVGTLAELEDMARYATCYYTGVRPEDLRWILVEAGDRILPEVGEYAVRQARVLADNVAAAPRAALPRDYRHRYAGSVASLGLHKGIAYVYGHRLKGYPAWLMHRAYHLGKLATVGRKAHVLAEWTLAGLFKREIVALGSLEHHGAEFELATRSGRGPDGD